MKVKVNTLDVINEWADVKFPWPGENRNSGAIVLFLELGGLGVVLKPSAAFEIGLTDKFSFEKFVPMSKGTNFILEF